MFTLTLSQYLIPPVIGGIIGWSTNKLAIWMLFNPKKERRVFGIRIPFTPGLIPRDQIRIARSLGRLVEEKLIDSQEIHDRITRETVSGKIEELMDRAVEKNMGKFYFLIPETAMCHVKKLMAPKISSLVRDELLGFIDLVNFRELVEERVTNFPLAELEEAIRGVVKRHLTHITILGGVLGVMIGLVQVAVSLM